MFQNPKRKPAAEPALGNAAARHRDRMAKRSRDAHSEISDVGVIPPVVNPERRERCRTDLNLFLATYFPHSTGQGAFSPDHIRAIKRIEACIMTGGLFQNCFPRGYGKSTISENSAIFAVAYGWRRFLVIVGAAQGAAMGMLDSIKKELSENDLLYQDFPEICHPVRALEGKVQRCASQHHDGSRTHIEWTSEKVALPVIAGSAAGGAVIEVRGITGAIRGLKHKMPNGDQQRPDLVIIDDPQTAGSAATDLQVKKRMDILAKDILKLGGHQKTLAAVMNATVIRRGDMADQIADYKKNPAWQSERIKMIKRWADGHDTLWLDQYATIRNTYDPMVLNDRDRAIAAATKFYKKNRAAMDAGCEVTWEECFNRKTELSAVQHAYNMRIDDGPEVFQSECQNDPIAVEDLKDGLTAEQLCVPERFNGVAVGVVPQKATRLVAHIDVMGKLLYWMVVAFDEFFGPTVVAYGTWPDEPRPHFTMRDSRQSIRAATGADSEAAAVRLGVQKCIDYLATRQWLSESGSRVPLEKIGVDSKWGTYTDEVFAACRESEHKDIVVPTQGKYYGVKSEKRIEDFKPSPGDRQGTGWRYYRNPANCKRRMPWLLIDTNRWKTFTYKSLTTSPGTVGALMFNGVLVKGKLTELGRAERHRLLAEHLTSEKGEELSNKDGSRVAIEWGKPDSGRDNHWWDNLVSCCVIAAVQGVREPTAAPVRIRKRYTYADIQKQRAG